MTGDYFHTGDKERLMLMVFLKLPDVKNVKTSGESMSIPPLLRKRHETIHAL
jgi:hypothetical protein